MKPKVSNFLLESRKRKSGNARGLSATSFFTGRIVADNPRTILTLLRHSSLFLGGLSASFRLHRQEKWLCTQNAKLCDIPASFFSDIPPTPAGGFCSRLLGALLSVLPQSSGCRPPLSAIQPRHSAGARRGVNCHAFLASHAYFVGQYSIQPCLVLEWVILKGLFAVSTLSRLSRDMEIFQFILFFA